MRERFALGSSLIQVYSGWIYGGLDFLKTLHQALSGSKIKNHKKHLFLGTFFKKIAKKKL